MAILNVVANTIVYTPLVILCISVLVAIGYGIWHYRNYYSMPESYVSVVEVLITVMKNILKPIKWLLQSLWWLLPIGPGLRAKVGYTPKGAWESSIRFNSGLTLLTVIFIITSLLIFINGYPSTIIGYSQFLTGTLIIITSLLLFTLFIFSNNKFWKEGYPEGNYDGIHKEHAKWAFKKTSKYLYYTIALGLVLAILGILFYLTINYGVASIASSSILLMVIMVGLMFFLYNKAKNNNSIKQVLKKSSFLSSLFNIVFIIPCLFQDTVKFIFNQVRHTPDVAYGFLAGEIILIGLYIIYPIVKKYIYTFMPPKDNKEALIKAKIRNINDEQIIIEAKKDKILGFGNLNKSGWNSIISKNLNNEMNKEGLRKKLIDYGYKDDELEEAIIYVQKNTNQLISLRMKHEDNIERLTSLEEELSTVNDMQKSKILLDKPVYLENKKYLSSFEDVKMDNFDMEYNYNYSISCWVFIRAQPPNFGEQYNKYTSILNYGEKPNIMYNGKLNKLKIIMNNGRDKTPVEHIIDNFPLQKWSNIVINYDGGVFDIFMNSKLLASMNGIVPYMSQDQITVGDDNGIGGGICNVVYFPNSISKERIDMNYKILSNKNPPII